MTEEFPPRNSPRAVPLGWVQWKFHFTLPRFGATGHSCFRKGRLLRSQLIAEHHDRCFWRSQSVSVSQPSPLAGTPYPAETCGD
jgi:hypothetical protein